jgi:hypothetical protein
MTDDIDAPEPVPPSDADSPRPTYAVGYGRPPTEHRFKAGTSGNPRGRPPKPVRALMKSQLRRDIIKAGETTTRVRTAKGTKEMPVIEAVYLRLAQKALNGHGPSMRRLIDSYNQAVAEHDALHKKHFGFIELVEKEFVENTNFGREANRLPKFLNDLYEKHARRY